MDYEETDEDEPPKKTKSKPKKPTRQPKKKRGRPRKEQVQAQEAAATTSILNTLMKEQKKRDKQMKNWMTEQFNGLASDINTKVSHSELEERIALADVEISTKVLHKVRGDFYEPITQRLSVVEKNKIDDLDKLVDATAKSKQLADVITKAVNDKPTTINLEPSDELVERIRQKLQTEQEQVRRENTDMKKEIEALRLQVAQQSTATTAMEARIDDHDKSIKANAERIGKSTTARPTCPVAETNEFYEGAKIYRRSVSNLKSNGHCRLVLLSDDFYRFVPESNGSKKAPNGVQGAPNGARSTSSGTQRAPNGEQRSQRGSRGPTQDARSSQYRFIDAPNGTRDARQSDTNERRTIKIDMYKIEKYLKVRLYQVGEPVLSINGNPIVRVQINCRRKSDTLTVFKELHENRKTTTKVAISPLIPDGHNIDQVLRLWTAAGVIQSFDTTKAGFYVIFVNDGDQTIQKENKDELRKYLNSCTRINVENPRALALCALPTIANLRKIAKRTHIVARSGELVKTPSMRGRGSRPVGPSRYTPFIADNAEADKVTDDACDRLREFLINNGLVEAQDDVEMQ